MSEFEPQYLTKEEINEMLDSISEEEEAQARSRSMVPLKEQIFFEGDTYGAEVRDTKGNSYIDCTAQAWTLNAGWVSPDIAYAVSQQMKRITHVRYGYPTIPRLKLINKITSMFPDPLNKVVFNNSGGGSAIEASMKMAIALKQPADVFVTFWRGYHGSSMALTGASHFMPMITRFKGYGNDHYVKAPYPYCYRCPIDLDPKDCGNACLALAEGAIKYVPGSVAGVLIEPMQGPGGQVPTPDGYLKGLRDICDKYGIFLIFDECQTAWGRIGDISASHHYGVFPDMMVFTKAVGGGLPLGVMLGREDFPQFTDSEEHSTFSSNPTMFVSSLTYIALMEKMDLPGRAKRQGEKFTKGLWELYDQYEMIGDIRGPGLFIGVELVKDRETKEASFDLSREFVHEGMRQGVIFDLDMPNITVSGVDLRNVIKIKPPLVITDEQVERVLEVFEHCLKHISAMR
jgi:4-aminobutyrate aminotransferase-like enzyme